MDVPILITLLYVILFLIGVRFAHLWPFAVPRALPEAADEAQLEAWHEAFDAVFDMTDPDSAAAALTAADGVPQVFPDRKPVARKPKPMSSTEYARKIAAVPKLDMSSEILKDLNVVYKPPPEPSDSLRAVLSQVSEVY